MSAEGAWDMAKESHKHGDNLSHQVDVKNQVPVKPDPLFDEDGNRCGHLCHYSSSIIGEPVEFVFLASSNDYVFDSFSLTNRSQAPPTPPPNV